MDYRFEIAFSFAGPHRDKVRQIAEIVARKLGRARVFFDEWFEAEILGSDMDVLLQRFYAHQSRMVVADISDDYALRPWTQAEARAIRALRFTLDPARDEVARLRLVNIRFAAGDVPGVLITEGWLDGIHKSAEDCARVLLERHALLCTRQRTGAGAGDIEGAPARNPFRGLVVFESADADYFFGRDLESAALAIQLKVRQFACVSGPSGNGKSSLVRAGLMSAAADQAVPGVKDWPRLICKPQGDWLRKLLEQLCQKDPNPSAAVAGALERILGSPTKVGAPQLLPPPAQAAEQLHHELSPRFPNEGPVLLILDQFEEVFTHRSQADFRNRESRIRFQLDLLAAFVALGDSRWHVVLTMRSDFLPQARDSQAFSDLCAARRFSLEELTEAGFRAAISGPAGRAHLSLEAGLVDAILRDRQTGSMPLLQHALQQLWEHRDGGWLRNQAYQKMGGLVKALQQRAEQVLQKLGEESSEYLEIARNVFIRLTALGEGVSDSRRRAAFDELEWISTPAEKVNHVVKRLTDPKSRLIVADTEGLEVTHEVLIRESETISLWISNSRESIYVLRRLTNAARNWRLHGRELEFLALSDPVKVIKKWVKKAGALKVTEWELEFFREARRHRIGQRNSFRQLQKAQLAAESARVLEAEARLVAEASRAAEAEARSAAEKARAAEAENRTRDAEKARRKVAWLAAALLVIAGLAGYAAILADRSAVAAEAARRIAEGEKVRADTASEKTKTALAQMILRSIGAGQGSQPPSPSEVEALWELAEQSGPNKDVRALVARGWSEDPRLTWSATGGYLGLHALLGDPADFGLVEKLATARVEALLEDNGTDSSKTAELVRSLACLARYLPPPHAEMLFRKMLAAVTTPPARPSREWKGVESALEALVGVVPVTSAAEFAQQILLSIRATAQPNNRQYGLLGLLPELLRRLPPEQSEPLAFGFCEWSLSRLRPIPFLDFDEAASLGSTTNFSLALMPQARVQKLGEILSNLSADRLVKKVEEEPLDLFFRVPGLFALFEVTPLAAPNLTGPLADRLSFFLVDGLRKKKWGESHSAFINYLEYTVRLIAKMPAPAQQQRAREASTFILPLLEDSRQPIFRLSQLLTHLARLAPSFDESKAKDVAKKVLALLIENKIEDAECQSSLCRTYLACLQGRAPWADPTEIEKVFAALIEENSYRSTVRTGAERLRALKEIWLTAIPRLQPERRSEMAQRLLAAVEANRSSFEQSRLLLDGVAEVAAHLPQDQIEKIVGHLVEDLSSAVFATAVNSAALLSKLVPRLPAPERGRWALQAWLSILPRWERSKPAEQGFLGASDQDCSVLVALFDFLPPEDRARLAARARPTCVAFLGQSAKFNSNSLKLFAQGLAKFAPMPSTEKEGRRALREDLALLEKSALDKPVLAICTAQLVLHHQKKPMAESCYLALSRICQCWTEAVLFPAWSRLEPEEASFLPALAAKLATHLHPEALVQALRWPWAIRDTRSLLLQEVAQRTGRTGTLPKTTAEEQAGIDALLKLDKGRRSGAQVKLGLRPEFDLVSDVLQEASATRE